MKRIKELRKEKGLTQEKFAKVIGVSRSAISMYEIDASEPDFNILNRIADFFNVSIDYILGREKRINESKNSTPLTEREQELLNIFRKCDKGEQSRILGYSESLLKK